MKKPLLVAGFVLATVSAAFAMQGRSCMTHGDMLRVLFTQKKQAFLATAVARPGFAIQIFVSQRTRSWSLVAIDATGRACVMLEGEDFTFAIEKEG